MNKEIIEAMGLKIQALEARREETALRIRSLAEAAESLHRDIAVLSALQEEQEIDLRFLFGCLMAAMEE